MKIIITDDETPETPNGTQALLRRHKVPYTVEVEEWGGDDPNERFPIPELRRPNRVVSFSLDFSTSAFDTVDFLVDLLEHLSLGYPWEIVRHPEWE